ncbi:MAG: F0F1 ATP synthase subunit epsilon [Actinobacteria bacterium]|nr:F0F1 ATP synthase subunit epsilon [Actinomycetota bacterium]
MTLRAALVVPDRELWSGEASIVIAKTTEGDIGVLTGHSPVFGVLAEASVVEIDSGEGKLRAAVSGGFLSVADDRVSVLAAQAQLGEEVDIEEARHELAAALAEGGAGAEDSPAVKYARARLRAAGQA